MTLRPSKKMCQRLMQLQSLFLLILMDAHNFQILLKVMRDKQDYTSMLEDYCTPHICKGCFNYLSICDIGKLIFVSGKTHAQMWWGQVTASPSTGLILNASYL